MSGVGIVARAPVRARTWREIAFVVVSLPGAVLGLALVVLAAAGLATTPVAVGIPVLLATLVVLGWHRTTRRVIFRALLRVSWEQAPVAGGRRLLTDAAAWRAVAYAATSAPVLLVGGYAVLLAVVGGLFLISAPLWWWASPTGWGLLEPGSFAASWYLVPGGLVALLSAPWIARVVVLADGGLARFLLAADRSVVRLRELERRRTALVEDNEATLRRVERELHDGTQAALVAVGVSLARAGSRVAAVRREPELAPERLPEVSDLLEAASGAVTTAVDQLRDIVRRLHPPALDDGLAVAVRTLAAHSGLPVDVRITGADAIRPGPATAVYFAAAELLSNAARHAGARHVGLSLTQTGPRLCLTVQDDGRGGAREAPTGKHTGLSGLRRRIEAIDGTMSVDSPAGGPTHVSVSVPVGAADDGGRQ